MKPERRSVTKTVDGRTISVTVENVDGWLIREIHCGGKSAKEVDALQYSTAEEALEAGIVVGLSLPETHA